MRENTGYTAKEALELLKNGNVRYLTARRGEGDVSPSLRKKAVEGQAPYAVIVTCSDSRVLPESIFSAGIGELFVIRVAGNIIGVSQLASIEYAVEHLGSRLVVVMGHDHCGAIGAALSSDPDGYVKLITDEIKRAIGTETDNYRACCLNVQYAVRVIRKNLKIFQEKGTDFQVCGAIYHLNDGRVEFL